MSIKVMQAVWQESQSVGRARLVLLAIADHQGEIGAWPSIETIANMVNASERSVQRDIQELVDLGELLVLWRQAPTKNRYKANLYWVNLPSVSHLFDDEQEVTDEVDEVTNEVHEVTDEAHEVTARGVLTITRTITEPLLNNSSKFNEFYKHYPRKVGKQDAKKSFARALTIATVDEIIDGVIRYANDPNLSADKTFIPYPATWLNKGMWDDEPLPERTRTPEEIKARELAAAQYRREVDLEHTRKVVQESVQAAETAEAPHCEHGRIIAACMPCIRAGKI
jgi:DNA-binding Lrp family transcriptional regulator